MTTEEPTVLINPLLSYSIREDGFITIFAVGETGSEIRLLFNDEALLDSAWLGLKDARNVFDMYQCDGFAEACEYVNEGAEAFEFNEHELTDMLDDEGT